MYTTHILDSIDPTSSALYPGFLRPLSIPSKLCNMASDKCLSRRSYNATDSPKTVCEKGLPEQTGYLIISQLTHKFSFAALCGTPVYWELATKGVKPNGSFYTFSFTPIYCYTCTGGTLLLILQLSFASWSLNFTVSLFSEAKCFLALLVWSNTITSTTCSKHKASKVSACFWLLFFTENRLSKEMWGYCFVSIDNIVTSITLNSMLRPWLC